MVLLQI